VCGRRCSRCRSYYSNLILTFFFTGRGFPRSHSQSCGLDMGSLWLPGSPKGGSPLSIASSLFPQDARWPASALLKVVGRHPGLRVPVPFKTFGSCSGGTFCGDRSGRSGPHSCWVACPCGGHSALRLASTMHGIGASTSCSTSPFPMARTSWGHLSMAEVLARRAPPTSSETLAAWSGRMASSIPDTERRRASWGPFVQHTFTDTVDNFTRF
jgi:hypothetical protein